MTMLWTDEAVDILKRLAQEGRSASVIAAALGAPSRNAVIGKANRIGVKLNGGPGGFAPGERAEAPLPRPRPAPIFVQPQTKAAPAPAEVGEMRRLRFADIGEPVCRWPLGDPRSGDFAYCGLEAAAGRSYCAGHCRMAYRPPRLRTGQGGEERRGVSAFARPWRFA